MPVPVNLCFQYSPPPDLLVCDPLCLSPFPRLVLQHVFCQLQLSFCSTALGVGLRQLVRRTDRHGERVIRLLPERGHLDPKLVDRVFRRVRHESRHAMRQHPCAMRARTVIRNRSKLEIGGDWWVGIGDGAYPPRSHNHRRYAYSHHRTTSRPHPPRSARTS